MSDELIDKLGNYFTYHHILERYDITFDQFVRRFQIGTWEAWLA